MAKAAGIKFSAPSINPGLQASAEIKPLESTKSSGWATVGASTSSGFTSITPPTNEPKKGGWKSFSASSDSTTKTGSGGWSRVGSSDLGPPAPLDPPPPMGTPPPLPSDDTDPQAPIDPPPPTGSPPPLPTDNLPPLPAEPKPTRSLRSAPVFHSSGWTNLTHQLEERSVVDTNIDQNPKDKGQDGDEEMSYTPPTSKPTSPKNMVIDVDALYPPTPVQPVVGRYPPKTPAWRIHEAPSPSPHVGLGMRGNPAGFYSPIAGLSRGPHGRRNMDNDKPEQKEGQPSRRAWSPMNELSTAPPGWKRMGS
jgi:hypothetical protein